MGETNKFNFLQIKSRIQECLTQRLRWDLGLMDTELVILIEAIDNRGILWSEKLVIKVKDIWNRSKGCAHMPKTTKMEDSN